MTVLSRRALLLGAAATGAGTLAACTDDASDSTAPDAAQPEEGTPTEPPTAVTVAPAGPAVLSGDGATLAAGLSALLFSSSPVAVLTPEDPATLSTAGGLAELGHWPVLVGSEDDLPGVTADELSRLGVEHVLIVSPPATATATTASTGSPADTGDTPTGGATSPAARGSLPDGAQVHTVPAGANPAVPQGVPVGAAPQAVPAVLLAAEGAAGGAAEATARALGLATHTDLDDPREDAAVMAALRATPDLPLLTLGEDDPAGETLLVTATMAQRAAELPGGGVTCFPHRRMIALYGHPGAPVLGLLGEQGVEGSVRRVGEYVERYSPLVEETVIPAWEIIASVATAGAGDDGNYSKVWEVEKFRPWVDAAKEAGIYVVLDLQPGRSDFLTQAKEYEELLLEPHVGLALDPEWRLGPNERHLVRIGHVEAAEINSVSDWLAALVRENDLPQKVLTLHQFRLSMIRDRDQVRTDHPEIAVVLHADGQGGQGAKQDTWGVLKEDLPEGMWLGWKNFYDEDSPMLTPEQTIARVDPTPWFISYQ